MAVHLKNNWLLCLLFVGVVASPTASQVIPEKELTLRDAVLLALDNNPELKIAQLEVERSKARVNEAWGYALPALDFSGRYTRTLKRPVFFANFGGQQMSIEMGYDHAFDLALTGRQVLFNGAVIVGVGAAKVYSQLARDLFTSKKVETVAKVRKAYYGALLAREVVNLMYASLRNAENNLKNVLVMSKQGIISEYDELRATVQVENLRPMVIQSENNYELALDVLRNAMGVDKSEIFILVDSLRFEPMDDSLLSHAEEIVLLSNPNLAAVSQQIELNTAAIFAEQSNYLPTIAAFGQYQFQGAKNEFIFSPNDFYRSTQVGLTVSINIFQGLQTHARVEQAQVERQKSEEQKISLERTLKTGIHSVVGNIKQARKRLEAQEKTVETAERGYKIVTARFLTNAATQLEVNDAEVALTQAKVNRIQAMYDYLVAAAELDQLIGRLPEYVVEKNEKL